MTKIKKLVLDVLKPHEPSIILLAGKINEIKGVDFVDIIIASVDRRVETAKITIEGTNLNYDKILKEIQDNGATVKSIDQVLTSAREEKKQ